MTSADAMDAQEPPHPPLSLPGALVDGGAVISRLAIILGRGDHLLARAEQHVGGSMGAELLAHRLAPDMLSLAEQVVVLADSAWGAAALLAGKTADEVPAAAWVFNRGGDLGPLPASVSAARQRIQSARAAVEVFSRQAHTAAMMDGSRTVVVARPGDSRHFSLCAFVHEYVLPNAYFHLTLIHALLRHCGVPLGKADYEGPPSYARPGIAAVHG